MPARASRPISSPPPGPVGSGLTCDCNLMPCPSSAVRGSGFGPDITDVRHVRALTDSDLQAQQKEDIAVGNNNNARTEASPRRTPVVPETECALPAGPPGLVFAEE
ncbi:unnamed protein product [Arctogadus glacialis]